MPRPVTIAVLSDQHIWKSAEPDSWELARRAFEAAAESRADHVILAGDTFDCAAALEEDRERVERRLRKLGLWRRDRLSIVVGGHDFFHTPHRGSLLDRAAELASVAKADAQRSYETFCEWAGDLVAERDRLAGDEGLFPFQKRLGHVRLLAADTTSRDSLRSGKGYWTDAGDKLLRAAAAEGSARTVLAIHNAPFEDEPRTMQDILAAGPSLGFPKAELRRLRRFVEDAEVEALVCGHVHDFGDGEDDPWSWQLGERWKCEVHVVGRTGGVHGSGPCFGLLGVPVEGGLTWETIALE